MANVQLSSKDENSSVKDIVTMYKSLSSNDRNSLLEILIDNSEPDQLYFLSNHLPILFYRDFITYLPAEVVTNILKHLTGKQLLACCQVCKSWNNCINSLDGIWHIKAYEVGVDVHVISSESPNYCKSRLLKENYRQAVTQLHGLKASTSFKIVEPFEFKGEMINNFHVSNGHIITGHCNLIKIWSQSSLSLEKTIVMNQPQHILLLKHSLLFTYHYDVTVTCWNINTGVKEHNLIGHTSAVLTIDVTADKKFVITGSKDKSIKVWNLCSARDSQLLMTMENVHTKSVSEVYLIPHEDNEQLKFISCDSKSMFHWSLDVPARHVEYDQISLQPNLYEYHEGNQSSCYFDIAKPDIILISQFLWNYKISSLAIYHLHSDTRIEVDQSWILPIPGLKAHILGAGSRFTLLTCSISCMEFYLFDLARGSLLVSFAVPNLITNIKICDTSWLDGFVFGKKHEEKPFFIGINQHNTILIMSWCVPKHNVLVDNALLN